VVRRVPGHFNTCDGGVTAGDPWRGNGSRGPCRQVEARRPVAGSGVIGRWHRARPSSPRRPRDGAYYQPTVYRRESAIGAYGGVLRTVGGRIPGGRRGPPRSAWLMTAPLGWSTSQQRSAEKADRTSRSDRAGKVYSQHRGDRSFFFSSIAPPPTLLNLYNPPTPLSHWPRTPAFPTTALSRTYSLSSLHLLTQRPSPRSLLQMPPHTSSSPLFQLPLPFLHPPSCISLLLTPSHSTL